MKHAEGRGRGLWSQTFTFLCVQTAHPRKLVPNHSYCRKELIFAQKYGYKFVQGRTSTNKFAKENAVDFPISCLRFALRLGLVRFEELI